MKKIIFVAIILSLLYAVYNCIDITVFFSIGAFLQAFVPLLLLSTIFFNKKLAYLFKFSSKQNNMEYVQCLEVVKGIQRISIYLSIVYEGIYFYMTSLAFSNLTKSTTFRIPLYLCLFNFLILLPLEAKLKIKLVSEK